MTTNKYEYMLHTWGGFYNKKHQVKHGYTEGYRWFDTKGDRDKYIAELREVARTMQGLGANTLAISTAEGTHTRYKTIAKMVFVYQAHEYVYEYDFGFAYPPESAEYMFTEGNYACDCNRGLFIGCDLECGEEVKMKNFEVNLVLDTTYVCGSN
jgi:hypothetical protein